MKKISEKGTDAEGSVGHHQGHPRCIVSTPEEEEEEHAGKISEKVMAPNLPSWIKDLNLHIQEVQQIPSRKIYTRSRHYSCIVKDKERLEILKQQLIPYKESAARSRAPFSSEATGAGRQRMAYFKC